MPRIPRHLRSLPPHVLDALTDEQKRDLADLATDRDRRRQLRQSRGWANGPEGFDALPEFLREIERAHPRAADLWLTVRPGSPLANVREIGAGFGLSAESVDLALAALRRAELATISGDGPGALVSMQSPASVPF